MQKIIRVEEIPAMLRDEMTIMVGGFLAVGSPDSIIQKIRESGVKNLTFIANDTSFPDKGLGTLIVNKQAKKVIATHIGTNPETGKQMISGEIEVELVPQGTLAERIRAGGSGIGGILTPTGLGTVVEEGKEKIEVDGCEFILEKPLRADLAIIKAHKADKSGNLVYRGSARNFNPLMALAADVVIAEVENIVEVGEIDPNEVMTPGILIDKIIVKGGN